MSLVYLEPDTDFSSGSGLQERSLDQLTLGLTPKLKSVEIKPDSFIEGLLQKATEISDLSEPPKPTRTCQNCLLVESLSELVSIQKLDLLVLEQEMKKATDFSSAPIDAKSVIRSVQDSLSAVKKRMGLDSM